jgi:hypothetical protein
MKTLDFTKAVISTEHECCCNISWDISNNELTPEISSDVCWVGHVCRINDEPIVEHLYGESANVLVEDLSIDDIPEEILDKMELCDLSFNMGTNPSHEERKEEALIKFLQEKEADGWKLMRDNERGFSNEYTCVLVSPESIDEIDPDWDELEADYWASEFLYKGDDATQAFTSFKLL